MGLKSTQNGDVNISLVHYINIFHIMQILISCRFSYRLLSHAVSQSGSIFLSSWYYALPYTMPHLCYPCTLLAVVSFALFTTIFPFVTILSNPSLLILITCPQNLNWVLYVAKCSLENAQSETAKRFISKGGRQTG